MSETSARAEPLMAAHGRSRTWHGPKGWIMTYKDGRWGSSGGIGVMMYHDYTNDLGQ